MLTLLPRPLAPTFATLAALLLLVACGGEAPTPADTPPPPAPDTTQAPAPGAPEGPEPTDPASQVMGRELHRLATRQAHGLGQGVVKVHGAWNYSGYSYLSPDPAALIPARLVAIDLTVSGHTTDFDLDDIEIVDGGTKLSYGSDPHVTFLTPDGKTLPEDQPVPVAPAATRVLLIYGFPKSTPTFELYYWGNRLTGQPVKLAESGWGLLYPEPASAPPQ